MSEPSPHAIPRRWREGAAEDPSARRAKERRRKIFTYQVLILALACAIVGMLLWIKPIPHPRFVPVWVARPVARQIPSTPMAEADLKFVTDRLGSSAKVVEDQDHRALADGLTDRLKALGLTESIVVYVKANAAATVHDDAGPRSSPTNPARILVLAADADPNSRQNWVELRTLLEKLRDDSRARHKLLVLDVMNPTTDPRLGLLADDVAARVADDLEAVKDSRRLTLCACSPGQIALDSETLGRSVFNYYAEEGLRGWADGSLGESGRDGVVSAREWSNYVASHVDRWARRNRNTRQLPFVFGEARDFPLVALDHDKPRPHLAPPEARTYPEWLLTGWRLRDHWRTDQSARTAPWAFRKLEASLLAAERDWRGGVDPDKVEDVWISPLMRMEQELREARDLPRPKPARSLALAEALGRKPDAAAAEALAALLEQRAEQIKTLKPDEREKALAKPVADFLVHAKAWPALDLAAASFAAAADDARPSAEKIDFLDRLLLPTQPEPQFEETLVLHRLAELARRIQEDNAPWPTSAARLVLDLARRGQRAESQFVPFPWVRGLLDEAAQIRHDGEIRLWEHGFASIEEAEQMLGRASEEYATILKYEDAIQDGWRVLDEALFLLPAAATHLDDASSLETVWFEAIREAEDLYAALSPPKQASAANFGFSRAELPPRIEDLRQQTQILRDHLEEIRQPFTSSHVARLVEQSKKPDADGELAAELDALLANPLPSADDRLSLWTAGIDLSRRLNEETLSIDHQEATTGDRSADDASSAEKEEAPRDELEGVQRRARRSIALLSLAGFDLPLAERSEAVEEAMTISTLTASLRQISEPDVPSFVPYQLARDLQRAWAVVLPARFKRARDLALKDRLSRLAPPFDSWPSTAEIKEHPTIQWRAERARFLWQWLADRHDYETRDIDGAPLHIEAAASLRGLLLVSQHPSEKTLELSATPGRLELSASIPSAALTAKVSAPQTITAPMVNILKPASDWLTVRREPGVEPSYRIDLKRGDRRSGSLPPKGVLIQARVNGRSYHLRVPITLPEAAEPWQILLGDGPDSTPSAEGDLRLRPVKDRQLFALSLLNPTSKPRKVSVEVKDLGSGIANRLSFQSQGSGQIEKVGGTAASPKPEDAKPEAAPVPEPELPEFVGPLQIQVLDEENGRKILTRRLIAVGLASPLEYVRVADVRFEPPKAPGIPNRLTLKLKAETLLTGPPALIEMVLPAQRIPGFVAAPDGTFQGVLPPDGKELQLFARNIQFRDGDSEQGIFYVNIDGVPRALIFKTTFARQGSPTTPRLDFEPEIRLAIASRAALPGARNPAVVEVDNAPYDAALELSLGHFERGAFVADAEPIRETRKRRIGFGLTAGGALVFETAVKDWSVPLRTSGIEGRRVVRARLLDAEGTEIKAVSLSLVLDESAPRRVRIVGVPPQVRRGSTLEVKAIGTPTESGTKQAVFFFGKPVNDALPPNVATIPAQALDAEKTTWAAKIPLPENQKGTVELSVQFVNNVEKSSFDTVAVELTEGDAVPPGVIQGKVIEGDRPQAKRKVFLYDAKGVARDVQTTDKEGAFRFENLAPGRYGLVSVKSESATRSQDLVDVKSGETAKVEMKLRR